VAQDLGGEADSALGADTGVEDSGGSAADGGDAPADVGADAARSVDAGGGAGLDAEGVGEDQGVLGSGPPYPVVLHHGWTGFEDIGPIDYFFRVRGHLEEHGFEVYVTEVSPYDDSFVRGAQLAQQLDEILSLSGAARVNIVAHSQGGIDTRYVISTLGYGPRVATLTTIATPHRGTPIGDAFLGLIPGWSDPMWDALAWLLGRAISDVRDDQRLRASMWQVSEEAMRAFNEDNPDDPRVAYFSWAGRTFLRLADEECGQGEMRNPPRVDGCSGWLQAFSPIVGGRGDSPPSDGLVPLASARWGRFRGCVPADHIDEVGHVLQIATDPLSGFNHLAFYLNIARFLRAEGH